MSERWIFDACAEEYHAVRRSYVPELIDDVVAFARLGPDDRVLDVGCGPGTATVQLETTLEEIVDVTSIEIRGKKDATLEGCLAQAAWDLDLPDRFTWQWRAWMVRI